MRWPELWCRGRCEKRMRENDTLADWHLKMSGPNFLTTDRSAAAPLPGRGLRPWRGLRGGRGRGRRRGLGGPGMEAGFHRERLCSLVRPDFPQQRRRRRRRQTRNLFSSWKKQPPCRKEAGFHPPSFVGEIKSRERILFRD